MQIDACESQYGLNQHVDKVNTIFFPESVYCIEFSFLPSQCMSINLVVSSLPFSCDRSPNKFTVGDLIRTKWAFCWPARAHAQTNI